MKSSPYRFRILVLAVSVVLLAIIPACRSGKGTGAVKSSDGALTVNPPPPPSGFSSKATLTAAYALKQLKLIETKPVVPAGVQETLGIEYGRVGDRSLQLDLYKPKAVEGRVPGLIFIHGGAWSGGSREIYKVYTTAYASKGFVAVTISYRLSGVAPFPAAIEDVKCAIRWMKKHAAENHVDPDRIAVIGGSAGGHLSMLAGYTGGETRWNQSGGNEGVDSTVRAVVNLYGVYDMTTPFAREAGPVKRFMGNKSYAEASDLYTQSSPSHWLKPGAPPTLILHGTIDEVVPIEQSDILAQRLADLGVPYVYDRLQGWPHTMDLALSVNERCQWFMDRFFERFLGPVPSHPAQTSAK